MERHRHVGALIGCALVGSMCACGPAAPVGPKLAPTSNRCPASFEEGPKGTCFWLPPTADASTPTVLYVHSASNEATISKELELVRAAVRDGMGILFARGSESECALASDVRATFCWPQAADDDTSESIWERWDKVQWQAEALLPEGTHPRLVVGFREGAAFAARAFERGSIHAQVVTLIAPGEGALGQGPYPPWLVGIGAPSSSAALFSSATVPAARCERDAAPALTASDLERALAVYRYATSRSGTTDASMPAGCTVHGPASDATSHPDAGAR